MTSQSYGKCKIRLTKVTRSGKRHSLMEMSIDVELDGQFEAAYTTADNQLIIPTDTMRNTVYALARQHEFQSIESFGQTLSAHFVNAFEHVSQATVRVTGDPWRRLVIDDVEHPHAFIGSRECETATVIQDGSSQRITSGLAELSILKTAGSGFSDFLRDEYTTLADAEDRVFATTVCAEWQYLTDDIEWSASRHLVRETLLSEFAQHDSRSVQHTLYAMAGAVLDVCPKVQAVTLQMPNQHRLLVDLQPFGLDNPNQVFVSTSEPFGVIRATVNRSRAV